MSDTSPPPGRGLRIALAASVGLNVLFVGFVAGAVLSGGEDDRRSPAEVARDLGLGPYVQALGPQDRQAIGRAVREAIRTQGGRPAIGAQMHRSFAEVLAIIRSDPFDPAALSALLEVQVERAEARRRMGQEALVAQLARMSPEARHAFADRLESRLRAHRHGPQR